MPKIYIEINRAINFNIDIYDTLIGEKFFNQHVEITKQDPVRAIPVITDFTKYTINYFIKLIDLIQISFIYLYFLHHNFKRIF